jgi:hypothetical protein
VQFIAGIPFDQACLEEGGNGPVPPSAGQPCRRILDAEHDLRVRPPSSWLARAAMTRRQCGPLWLVSLLMAFPLDVALPSGHDTSMARSRRRDVKWSWDLIPQRA